MSEFLSAVAGAVVGGLLTLAGTLWQTRHERHLLLRTTEREREATRWATGRPAARELLNGLAITNVHLLDFKAEDFEDKKHHGIEALVQMSRLAQTEALMLPSEISDRWTTLFMMLNDYFLFSRRDGLSFTETKMLRSRTDINAYSAYVRATLAEYIRTGAIVEHRDPPDLNRDGFELWSAT